MNNSINPQQLTNILIIIAIILVLLLVISVCTYIIIKYKNKKKEQESNLQLDPKQNESDAKKIAREYVKESVFKFMEFDKIEDNMIVQKNGNRYLMAIECQGINYDLMSNAEKISVEEGFLQFLNTLRHPIQIYIQTRTVNLSDSINNYARKVSEIKDKLDKMTDNYLKHQEEGYAESQLQKEFYEITKQTNLYEYAKDVLQDTERVSLNKNVLNKKYYIIIPCYPADLDTGNFDKEELKNLAFPELYTKAQSIIRTLSACEISGKIMSSNELVDLLYVAYNRDEAEDYGVDKALRGGYYELYSTAPDVLNKKMKELNRQIEKQALELANQKVLQIRNKREKEIDEIEENKEELTKQRAKEILEENKIYIGKKTAKKAQDLLEGKELEENAEEKKVKTTKRTKATLEKDTKEGGKKDVGQEKTRTKTTRKNGAK